MSSDELTKRVRLTLTSMVIFLSGWCTLENITVPGLQQAFSILWGLPVFALSVLFFIKTYRNKPDDDNSDNQRE